MAHDSRLAWRVTHGTRLETASVEACTTNATRLCFLSEGVTTHQQGKAALVTLHPNACTSRTAFKAAAQRGTGQSKRMHARLQVWHAEPFNEASCFAVTTLRVLVWVYSTTVSRLATQTAIHACNIQDCIDKQVPHQSETAIQSRQTQLQKR